MLKWTPTGCFMRQEVLAWQILKQQPLPALPRTLQYLSKPKTVSDLCQPLPTEKYYLFLEVLGRGILGVQYL